MSATIPMTPKTCQYCKWYKRTEGEFLVEENKRRSIYAKDPEVCTRRPPKAGLQFPLSYGETDASFACSKWEAAE